MGDNTWNLIESCWKSNPAERPTMEQILCEIPAGITNWLRPLGVQHIEHSFPSRSHTPSSLDSQSIYLANASQHANEYLANASQVALPMSAARPKQGRKNKIKIGFQYIHQALKADTNEQEKLFHGGLPPSFRPSMVMPSRTNPSIASPSTYLENASQRANEYLADASQALAHKLFSIRPRDMAPVRITCRDWDDGVVFDWYRRQTYTTISKLELRKERDHFKHEYIVIYLDNGWVHRIERRPIRGANFEPILKEGCEAEDSLTPVSDADLEVIRSETDAEITLEFGSNKPDFFNVIAVAVAIHLDPRTKNYTLQQYNCYFVARSIITLVTRHCLLQSSPTNGLRWDRVTESMILAHVFDGNWNKLLKAAMIPVLGNLIVNTVKEDAGTRIVKRKDWDRLKDIVNKVVRDEVERCDIVLAGDEIPKALTEWIIEATQVTLWHGNFQQSCFSEPQFSQLSDRGTPHVKSPSVFLRI